MISIDQPNNPHAAEILGDPRAFVAPVPNALSTFAFDVAPEHVAATAVQAAIVAERGTP